MILAFVILLTLTKDGAQEGSAAEDFSSVGTMPRSPHRREIRHRCAPLDDDVNHGIGGDRIAVVTGD
jgi:hypothetical protein